MPGTIRTLVEGFSSGRLTAREIVEAALRKIRETEPRIHAFVTVLQKEALAQADALDARRREGKPAGRLAGAVLALKDNLMLEGVRMTCGSRILENFIAPYDATVVERLRAEDAIFIGKTNLDEFAMGSSNEYSAFGPTRNPLDPERTPGGSSGGAAAAVAAGMAAGSIASDTGGSIRLPAAFTGTVGFKPTYGRVSRYGLVAFASSLDQVGPIGRTVEDCARLMDVLQGPDDRDSTSSRRPPEQFAEGLRNRPSGLRVGVPKEYFGEGVDPEVEAVVRKAIDRLGASVVDVQLPMTRYAIATYYVISPAEASSNLARYGGVHFGRRAEGARDLESLYCGSREGFGPEVRRRILLGTFTLSRGYYEEYYLRALKVRRLIKEDFDRAFERCDVIAGPTAPFPPFRLGERTGDPLQMYLCDVYTVSASLAGLPAVSVPAGRTPAGLPVGLQIQAPAFEDLLALRVASLAEEPAPDTGAPGA